MTDLINVGQQEALLGRVQQPARGLLGWMGDRQARLFLSGRQDVPENPEHTVKINASRSAVLARPVATGQVDVLADPPTELFEHIEALKHDAKGGAYFREGWSVRVV